MKTKESRKTKSQSRQTEPLADLPLTAEQAEEAKAGAGTGGGGGAGKATFQDLHITTRIA